MKVLRFVGLPVSVFAVALLVFAFVYLPGADAESAASAVEGLIDWVGSIGQQTHLQASSIHSDVDSSVGTIMYEFDCGKNQASMNFQWNRLRLTQPDLFEFPCDGPGNSTDVEAVQNDLTQKIAAALRRLGLGEVAADEAAKNIASNIMSYIVSW